jgi:hypothetical protein
MSNSILDLVSSGTTTIFQLLPNWESSPEMEIPFGREVIQYDEAATVFRFLTSDLGWKVSADFFNVSKSVEFSLLDFFLQHKGKLNKFWLPVQFNYFKLKYNIAINSTSLFFNDDSFQFVYQGYERLFMLLKSGDMITRKISENLGGGEYSVESAFDRAIAVSDVVLFGKIILCRFDQDELSLQYDTTDLSSCSLSFQELAKEYK